MPNRTCSIDDCDSPVIARGWCNKHYCRWRVHGDPLGQVVRQTVCSIEGCEKPFLARGWCSMHYGRWKNHGDPLAIPDKSVPNRHEQQSDTVGVLVITRRNGSEVRCLYDLADHELVTQHQWFMGGGYVYRNTRGGRNNTRVVSLHRHLIGLGLGDPGVVDHISGDRLDCRRRNLRIADSGLNGENRAVINELGTSRYRGVCWDKSRNLWKAYTRVNGRMVNLGHFPTEDAAAESITLWRAENGINTGYPRRHPDTPSKSRRTSA